jgi:hypothetical protein
MGRCPRGRKQGEDGEFRRLALTDVMPLAFVDAP